MRRGVYVGADGWHGEKHLLVHAPGLRAVTRASAVVRHTSPLLQALGSATFEDNVSNGQAVIGAVCRLRRWQNDGRVWQHDTRVRARDEVRSVPCLLVETHVVCSCSLSLKASPTHVQGRKHDTASYDLTANSWRVVDCHPRSPQQLLARAGIC